MRVLILGGDGMLGHRLYLHLRGRHEVKVTLRLALPAYTQYELFNTSNTYDVVDAVSFGSVRRAVEDYEPQVIVNAIGIVKQRSAGSQAVPAIEVNALFPHRLAVLCRGHGSRLIHISTDCVFSGRRGNYNEGNMPDATDLYGRSKLLGEVTEGNAITLRTSMIGRELTRQASLIEWFLSQPGPVTGFRRAIFSGFTTIELARVIERLIVEFPEAAGLYHVSSEPISKYDLLCLVRDRMRPGVQVNPDDAFQCDRSLDSTLFRTRFGYRPPTWEAMIDELARERRA
jgi:dTDP-4-dehydrorhamnose reductase